MNDVVNATNILHNLRVIFQPCQKSTTHPQKNTYWEHHCFEMAESFVSIVSSLSLQVFPWFPSISSVSLTILHVFYWRPDNAQLSLQEEHIQFNSNNLISNYLLDTTSLETQWRKELFLYFIFIIISLYFTIPDNNRYHRKEWLNACINASIW